jgi:outer membrane protein assembly factor BamB
MAGVLALAAPGHVAANDVVIEEYGLPKSLPSVVIDGNDGAYRTLADLPFDLSWQLDLPSPVHRMWASPEIPDVIFLQTRQGYIHAIETLTGDTRWVSSIALPRLIRLDPAVQREEYLDSATGKRVRDDRIYVISDSKLYVLDGAYGQVIWTYDFHQGGQYGFQPSSGPFAQGVAGSQRVYVGDWEGRLRVLHYYEERNYPSNLWQWNIGGVPSAQPVGMDGLAYTGDHNGDIRCFGTDRELVWEFKSGAPVMGPGFLRRTSYYIGNTDGVLFVRNRLSGEPLGQMVLGAPIVRAPFAFDLEPNRLYLFGEGDQERAGLYALATKADRIDFEDKNKYDLDIERLSEVWHVKGVRHLVGSSPSHLYCTRERSAVVLAVNRSTGNIDWHWDLNAGREGNKRTAYIAEYVDPGDELRSIITADRQGGLVAYRLFGQ